MKQLFLADDSKELARLFNKPHAYILKHTEKLIQDIQEINHESPLKTDSIEVFTKKNYEYKGRKYYYYKYNRPACSLLCMQLVGKEALEFQVNFIDTFYRYQDELLKLNPQLEKFVTAL